MKTKILSLIVFTILTTQIISCKKEIKKADAIEYIIEPNTTTINWTAYKTTGKIPVKGVFKTVNIANKKSSTNPFEAINGLEFSVPVNSIDSKDKTRDVKIVTNFFGSMKNTQALLGKIDLGKDGKGDIDLTMNGITTKLPISYVISGQLAEINATLNLDNWKAQLAIEALNKVCKDLHKGEDGISKTWSEVNIHIVSYLKVK